MRGMSRANGERRSVRRLVGGKGPQHSHPVKTIGSYWAVCDDDLGLYQPRHAPKQGRNPQRERRLFSYRVLLFRNEIIQQNDVIDAKTLPKIQMPNRNGFVPQRFEISLTDGSAAAAREFAPETPACGRSVWA